MFLLGCGGTINLFTKESELIDMVGYKTGLTCTWLIKVNIMLLYFYSKIHVYFYYNVSHVGPLCFKQQAQQRSALNHHTVASLEVFVIINFDQDKPAFRQKSVSWKLMTIMSVPLPRQNITPIRNQKKNQIKAPKI